MGTIAYFDCFSGAAGDMVLGALCDAGASVEALRAGLAGLGVTGYALSADKVCKQGLAATHLRVSLDDAVGQPHRHLRDIVEIIDSSELSASVKDRSKQIFGRLAEAEACVHGTGIEQIHFHEVGAVDAIVDVVGSCLALEMLGIDEVRCSKLVVGSGTVRCDHGVLPVPAPATAALVRGVPLADCDEPGELLTPTGAAILTTLATSYGPLGGMSIERIGYGAGTRDGKHRPNLLRVLIGRSADDASEEADEVVAIEANLDDASPEVIAHACDRLLDAGALDAFCIPVQMKKGRCGTLIQALARPGDADRIEEVLFAETPTFGVRRKLYQRRKLRRDWVTARTRFGEVRVKRGLRGSVVITASPEYEDCRRAAREHGVALRAVQEEAMRAYGDLEP